MEDSEHSFIDPVTILLEQAEAIQFFAEALELKASQLDPPLSTFLLGVRHALLMHEDVIHRAVEAIGQQDHRQTSEPSVLVSESAAS